MALPLIEDPPEPRCLCCGNDAAICASTRACCATCAAVSKETLGAGLGTPFPFDEAPACVNDCGEAFGGVPNQLDDVLGVVNVLGLSEGEPPVQGCTGGLTMTFSGFCWLAELSAASCVAVLLPC